MPELPEVETIRCSLEPGLVKRTIIGGEALLPKLIQNQTAVDFLNQIRGRVIDQLDRRGKYLLFRLSGDLVMAVHLRMTGQLILRKKDLEDSPRAKATYLILNLDDGSELHYADQRKFGRIYLFPAKSTPAALSKLGPEPLAPEFTFAIFQKRLAGRKVAIKKLLLNQEIIVGLGNIYTDEALFLAGIHPARPVDSLTDEELKRLYSSIKQVLSEGIQCRGTTKRDYLDGEGKPGSYQEQLRVYDRKGAPCVKCKNMIVKMNFGGRGTHFCPFC
ncbi:MAG TPA: DNA-formamidopyrimidine glycosylase, partial [Bacillota bacterium]|nr:DNA-formamidopyrimidine glycosylase [Bacillota bacterium]